MPNMRNSKLIILRGPSGSGKSTAAKILLETTRHKTVLIEQDYYRSIFKPAGGGGKRNSPTIHKMIQSNVLVALEDGYNVILEGILTVRSYEDVLETIFLRHPKDNYIFYFDVSLEETLRRHATRPKLTQFSETEMREWYPPAHKSGHKFEHIIPEHFSIEETIEYIKRISVT